MTRLQEVEQWLDSNLQLISDYSKRIATLVKTALCAILKIKLCNLQRLSLIFIAVQEL